MKSSPVVLLALVPFAFHLHHSGDRARLARAITVAPDSIRYVNADGDTAYIKTDSVARLIKTSPAQVIFLRKGEDPGVRVSRKVLARVNPASVTYVQIDAGPSFVMQYGDAAKPGVLTLAVKPQRDSTPAKPAKRGKKKKTS